MKQSHNTNIFIIVAMMLFAVSTRFITALPNFSPVVGLTLFGAAFLRRKSLAFILPLVLIYLSDFVINNTIARVYFPDVDGVVWYSDYMGWNFIAYVIIAALGIVSLKKVSMVRVLGVALGSTVLFFLISMPRF